MARVRIKHARPKDLAVRRRLLHLLAPEVKVAQLIPARDAIVAVTATTKDADSIFSAAKLSKLENDGFTVIMPLNLRAHRTVICTRLDDLAYDNNVEDIKDEIEKEQTWAKVQEVFKFPRSNTIKVTFKDTEMAKKATENGLLMFYMSIPSTQVHQEEYIELLTCTRCYAVEDHTTKDCPKPTTYQICSNCAVEGHPHWECKERTRKCINCGQDHHATAMRCPNRKEALKSKQEERRRQKDKVVGTSYAQASNATIGGDFLRAQMTGMMCVLNAHFVNYGHPGSFQKTLSESLARNGLPDVQLPPNPPSAAIINALTGQLNTISPIPPPPQPEKSSEDADNNSDLTEPEEPEVDPEGSSDSEESNHNMQKTIELEVQLVKQDKDKWPRTRTFAYIERCVKEGRYKLRHNFTNEDNRLVLNMLREAEDPIDDLFTSVDEEAFNKMSNGPLSEDEPDKKKKKRNKSTNRKV